jgi:hypothetical protein
LNDLIVIDELGDPSALPSGQLLCYYVNSIDGMRIFVRGLLGFGIQPDQVAVMLKDNPARLMYLDDDPAEREPLTHGYGWSVRRGDWATTARLAQEPTQD